MKWFLVILVLVVLSGGCRTMRLVERERVSVRADTVVRVDTVVRTLRFPSETQTVYRNRIDTVYVDRVRREVVRGEFTTDTLRTSTRYARAWAGVYRNVPFIGIEQDAIELQIEEYQKTITILQEKLTERERVVEKKRNNGWIWAFVAGLALAAAVVLLIRRRT